ncbi:MAG: hypothetical protein P8X88_07165, partial [Gammaproteobacteria bacterium]
GKLQALFLRRSLTIRFGWAKDEFFSDLNDAITAQIVSTVMPVISSIKPIVKRIFTRYMEFLPLSK